MAEMDFDGGVDTSVNTQGTSTVPFSASVTGVQQLGSSNPISYTPPKPEEPAKQEVPMGQRLAEDIQKPFVEVQHQIGSGLLMLGDNLKDNTPWGGLGDRITRAGIVMQERAQKSLAKNFSNFTPNMWDSIIGAVPTLGAFVGAGFLASPAVGTALGVGAVAAIGGAVTAEDYSKFKSQGMSTRKADALSLAIGIPTTAIASFGIAKVMELTSPWLTKVVGDTIGKIATNAIGGGAAGAGITATSGSLELATGATPYDSHESLKNLLTDTVNNTIIGTLLGGATALHYGFKQMDAITDGLQKLGVSNEQAPQLAKDIVGQGSHVVMDQIEKNIAMTSDEQGRVQVNKTENSGSVQPNVLERQGIPLDSFYPPIEAEPLTTDQVIKQSQSNTYVKLQPIDLQVKADEKLTAMDIRQKYMGNLDNQLKEGSYLRRDMINLAPEEGNAAFWAAHYGPEYLQKALEHPEQVVRDEAESIHNRFNEGEKYVADEEQIAKAITELKSHAADIEKALVISENGRKAIDMSQQYYKEAGEVAQSLGTIQEIRENYIANRLYKPEPPQDTIKITGKGGLKQFSAHSLERVYDHPIQAIAGGKRLATTNLPDLVAVHNQELAPVNNSRQLIDAIDSLKNKPLGGWVSQGQLPKGWKQVGEIHKDAAYVDQNGEAQMSRRIFAAPSGIADGLKALVDPDYFRRHVPGVATIQQLQAYTKTGLLGLSVYHDITFATQTAASIGGIETLATMPKAIIDGTMDHPAWREKESEFLQHNGTTTITHEVQDIMSKMEVSGNLIDQAVKTALKVPVIKQLGEISDAHTKFLFNDYQRYIKVETWAKEVANWEGKNPTATPEELRQAKIGFAQATNAEFGGRNWEALGVNKTVQSILRTFLLAPDWVMSMVDATKFATQGVVGKGGTAGIQARGTLFKAVAGGLAMSDAINYLTTGHHLWDNKKGHKTEIEVQPDVYSSMVRGAPGELLKLVSNVIESGGLQGAARYAEGKVSPYMAAAVTLTSGVNYFGASIWRGKSDLEKNINGVWEVVSHGMPVPVGIAGAVNYGQREGDQTALGWGMVSVGAGRFSKPSNASEISRLNDSVIKAYKNGNTEYVEHLIAKGDLSEDQAQHLKQESQKSDIERATNHMHVDKVIDMYKRAEGEDKQKLRDILDQKYDRFLNSKASPNEKKRVEKLYNQLDNS